MGRRDGVVGSARIDAREQEARPLLWRIDAAQGVVHLGRRRRLEARRSFDSARATAGEIEAELDDPALVADVSCATRPTAPPPPDARRRSPPRPPMADSHAVSATPRRSSRRESRIAPSRASSESASVPWRDTSPRRWRSSASRRARSSRFGRPSRGLARHGRRNGASHATVCARGPRTRVGIPRTRHGVAPPLVDILSLAYTAGERRTDARTVQ